MISFYRPIRHRLLNENKVTRYLLYATGEIVLVVIGILIALLIALNVGPDSMWLVPPFTSVMFLLMTVWIALTLRKEKEKGVKK